MCFILKVTCCTGLCLKANYSGWPAPQRGIRPTPPRAEQKDNNLPSLPEAPRYPIHHQRHSCYKGRGNVPSTWGLACSSVRGPAASTRKEPKYRCLPWCKVALHVLETQSQWGKEWIYRFSLVSTHQWFSERINDWCMQLSVHIQTHHVPTQNMWSGEHRPVHLSALWLCLSGSSSKPLKILENIFSNL